MADLTELLPKDFNVENYAKEEQYNTYLPPAEAFREKLLEYGFKTPPHITHNQLVRIEDKQDKAGKKSGWYFFSMIQDDNSSNAIAVGSFGSWHGDPDKVVWCSKKEQYFSEAERQRYNAQIAAARAAQEAETRARNDEAKATAHRMWSEAKEPSLHPYLKAKQIKAHGIRQLDDKLLIPIYDGDEIVSLQRIYGDGKKMLLKGGKKKGCYGRIDGNTEQYYICEGYSTAASIHEATGATVYIAIDCYNLYEAISNISARPLTICSDNDVKNDTNIGLNKAQQAGEGFGLDVIIPQHGGDFNDMHVSHGLDAVKAQLEHKPKSYEVKESKTELSDAPLGILADIAAYYNATSGVSQPVFAIQTALAIVSVICGRSFCSNYRNHSSMFFLNIGKSSTGKEHIKNTIQKVLAAADCLDLLMGEGYTSKGAVFSSLIGKPRHITVLDEFGRYMEASKKAGNSMQMEVNTQLMQSISSADGLMYSQVYSSMSGGGKDKSSKSEVVYNPAITLVGITTPTTFWENMDVSAIKDGFLNRFVIGISDTPRQVRQHKEEIAVPEKIVEWIKIMLERKPSGDVSNQKPDKVLLNFTQKADKMQEGFQEYCINIADKLEPMGMAEIVGRTNEMAMRIALICALARNPHAELIDDQDMAWGIQYMKKNVNRLLGDLKMSVSGSDHEKNKKEVLLEIRKHGEYWLKDMYKRPPFSKHKGRDLRDMLSDLVDSGLIDVAEVAAEGRGRPSKIYRAIQ